MCYVHTVLKVIKMSYTSCLAVTDLLEEHLQSQIHQQLGYSHQHLLITKELVPEINK